MPVRPHLATMSSEAITRDWANREAVEKVRMNIVSLANFLTRFDASVRDRLAKMNEKLATMERTLAHLSAATDSSRRS